MYTIHESAIAAEKLVGRDRKHIIGPDILGAKNMSFGTAVFHPHGKEAPPHSHPLEEEIIYIIEGEGKIVINEVSEPLNPGVCIYIPPTAKHQLINTGSTPMKVLYVFSPPVNVDSYEAKK